MWGQFVLIEIISHFSISQHNVINDVSDLLQSWFSLGTPVSSQLYIDEILLIVALNTITLIPQ